MTMNNMAKVILAVAAVAFLLKFLPRTSQTNMELIGMILPIHAAVWFGLRRLTSRDC
jgi:hypothetical protein